MKRVFAMLCALALVLPMICTGAAAAADSEEQQPEQYVFEKIPDIMYLDDFGLSFPFDGTAFYSEHLLPDGWYDVTFCMPQLWGVMDSVQPIHIVFTPEDDESVDVWDAGVPFDFYNHDLGVAARMEFFALRFVEVEGMTGTYVVPAMAGTVELLSDAYFILTRVDDPNAAPGGMPAVLGQMDTTVPSLLDTVYSMIRSNSLLAFLAFCGILAAAAALYSSLKAGAK